MGQGASASCDTKRSKSEPAVVHETFGVSRAADMVSPAVYKKYTRPNEEQFRNEVHSLNHLRGSDHFPQIHWADWDNLAFTMSYCGRPIREEKDCPDDWKEQLLEIGAFMRKNRICHNDIQPKNVMVDQTGKICVVDFGLGGAKDRQKCRSKKNLDEASVRDAKTCMDALAPSKKKRK